jgi:hypothetical protein
MPVPLAPISSIGAFWWLIGVAVASLLISGVIATTLHVSRTGYVAPLAIIAAAAWAGFYAWAGLDLGSSLTTNWGSGIGGGILVGIITGLAITRIPATLHRHGSAEGLALAWEGLVYGVAEGCCCRPCRPLLPGPPRRAWGGATWVLGRQPWGPARRSSSPTTLAITTTATGCWCPSPSPACC